MSASCLLVTFIFTQWVLKLAALSCGFFRFGLTQGSGVLCLCPSSLLKIVLDFHQAEDIDLPSLCRRPLFHEEGLMHSCDMGSSCIPICYGFLSGDPMPL